MAVTHIIEGHAIISADNMIADSEGRKPSELDHPADWARFQAALAEAAIVVLGRASHDITPNPHGRNRLVLSRSVAGLERRDDAWWWNPAGASLDDALQAAAPRGGIVAVTGGRDVFDFFLGVGFDAFHLVRNPAVTLPGGVPIFSACADGTSPEDVLEAHGMRPDRREMIDVAAGVELTVWRKS